MKAYADLHPYFGDLHNHCSIGYGHGTIEDSFDNARLQLDFACVTAHSYWPDIPESDERLARVVAYHQKGFQRAADEWDHFRSVVEANNEPGRFVTFLGFEWHSMFYGDHHVLFKSPRGEIIRAANLDEMRRALREFARQGVDGILFPHHIGYKQGYRGINWDTFDSEFSPVVEIMSMHGASESDEAPYPYLHTMGPRDWKSTLQYGLAQGKIVGVVGSTDHHSAHPGSYGHGRLGVWADALTRDGIWEALRARRTYALTGDSIRLAFAINDRPMGSVLAGSRERGIELDVQGGDEIDYIELLHNNRVIRRWNPNDFASFPLWPVKVHFEVGWGERNDMVDWQVELQVVDGQLVGVEPRFRGHEIVAPQATEEAKYVFSAWNRVGESGVRFSTRTWGNPTTTTASTQGMCLAIAGDERTTIQANINGRVDVVKLSELLTGSRAGYLGGFLTPCYYFHRAVPRRRYEAHLQFQHLSDSKTPDWYYVRVRQKNNQYAWSSPIWVEPS
jgi:Protein of unknown function (DUF3604)